jgi:PhnB protein
MPLSHLPSSCFPAQMRHLDEYQKPQGFSLQLNLSDPVEAERIFKALAENGTVQMPLQETFWALRFGVLVDQFGIPWLINCEKPA